MESTRQQLATYLGGLVAQPGVEGVELIRADGQCILERYDPGLDVPTFSRMSATLAAAGERVLTELRAKKADHVVADAGSHKIVVVQANEHLLLAALARADRPSAGLVRLLQDAAPSVTKLVRNA